MRNLPSKISAYDLGIQQMSTSDLMTDSKLMDSGLFVVLTEDTSLQLLIVISSRRRFEPRPRGFWSEPYALSDGLSSCWKVVYSCNLQLQVTITSYGSLQQNLFCPSSETFLATRVNR
jgi:hypothetical protein